MTVRHLTVSAGVLGVLAATLTTAPADADEPTHATNQAAARVVARVDVNGNGKRDVVRFTKRGKHKLVVRVRTDRGKVRRRVVRAPYIEFGDWYGAARLDGRSGRELVLLTAAGAHSLSYTVLTWRHGKLKRLNSPTDKFWFTDGAAMMGSGWLRRTNHGRVSMTERHLSRAGGRPVWRGKATRYVWKRGDWRKRGSHRIKVRGDNKAAKRFGWRGTTLPSFPGRAPRTAGE